MTVVDGLDPRLKPVPDCKVIVAVAPLFAVLAAVSVTATVRCPAGRITDPGLLERV